MSGLERDGAAAVAATGERVAATDGLDETVQWLWVLVSGSRVALLNEQHALHLVDAS